MRRTETALLLCTAALSACQFPSFRSSEDRPVKADAAALRSLRCDSHNGDVVITAASGPLVEGTATVTAYGHSDAEARANLAKLELVQEVNGDELRVTLRIPSDLQGDLALRLAVPPTLRLAIETHNGSVKVENAGAGLSAATHNGGIAFDTASGPVALSTHNGAIRGAIRGTALDASAETHNGAIALHLARECSASVTASTHNGGISLAGASDVTLDDGSATGKYGDGTGRLTLGTHNGAISVRVE